VILRHTFTPHDNNRLSHLCGPADAHLRTIEIAMGVKIAHRHEQFKIDGPKAKANDALELLQALYEMADDPIPDDSLQLMLAGDTELIEEPQDAIQLSTRRGDLRARTTNQAAYLENIARHDITFGIGPAGTGKTYLAVACAVVTGDVSQIDLPKGALSGLIDAERVLKRVKGIAINHFTSADVVRHPLVARIVDAYDARGQAAPARRASARHHAAD
jgi:phosphate starvation-inducible protein PhoH